jgi:hypothetical protein
MSTNVMKALRLPGLDAVGVANRRSRDSGAVMEAAAARGRDLKQARANRAWLDEAAEHGAADLDFSAVVLTIGDR